MESRPEEEKILVNFFSNQISDEIRLAIIEKLRRAKDFQSLAQVDHECRRLVKFHHAVFFNHFKYDSNNQEYILAADKLTVADIHYGNRLVVQAIALFLLQSTPSPIVPQDTMQVNPEILLRFAMCRYGSHHAMECIKQLSKCPGRQSLNFDMDPLIDYYEEKTKIVLMVAAEANFNSHDFYKYETDIDNAIRELQDLVEAFIYALKETYMRAPQTWYHTPYSFKDKMETYLDSRENDVSASGKYPFRTAKYEEFDAEGYIGLKAPRTENPWYLNPIIIAEYLRREELIDKVVLPESQLSWGK